MKLFEKKNIQFNVKLLCIEYFKNNQKFNMHKYNTDFITENKPEKYFLFWSTKNLINFINNSRLP